MASITIRQLDDSVKAQLRIQAAQHGRSMEEEARDLIRRGLAHDQPPITNLADAIRRRFARAGPVELRLPRRESIREPPDLDR